MLRKQSTLERVEKVFANFMTPQELRQQREEERISEKHMTRDLSSVVARLSNLRPACYLTIRRFITLFDPICLDKSLDPCSAIQIHGHISTAPLRKQFLLQQDVNNMFKLLRIINDSYANVWTCFAHREYLCVRTGIHMHIGDKLYSPLWFYITTVSHNKQDFYFYCD